MVRSNPIFCAGRVCVALKGGAAIPCPPPACTYSFFVLRGTKGSVTVTVCPAGMVMLSPDVKAVSGGHPSAAAGHLPLSVYVTLYPMILISKARPVAVVVGNCLFTSVTRAL